MKWIAKPSIALKVMLIVFILILQIAFYMCVPSAFSMYLYIYIYIYIYIIFLHVYGHLSAINYLLLLLFERVKF